MGLHTSFLAWLRVVAAVAFLTSAPRDASAVVIIDAMIWIRKQGFGDGLRTFSDLGWRLVQYLQGLLVRGKHTAVLVFDKQRYVPRTKEIEQEARRSKMVERHTLTDFGIARITDETPVPRDFNEFVSAREVRHRLFDYLADYLQRRLTLEPYQRVIVDGHDGGRSPPFRIQLGVRHPMPEHENRHGEGDTAMVYWTHALLHGAEGAAGADLVSVDSDMVLVCLLYVEEHGEQAPQIYLHNGLSGKTPSVLHINALRRALAQHCAAAPLARRVPQLMRTFAVLAMLSGTDFVKKFYGLTCKTVFERWLAKPVPLVTETGAVNRRRVAELLCALYSQLTGATTFATTFNGALQQLAAASAAHRHYKAPDPDTFHGTLARLEWNILYWTHCTRAHPEVPDPFARDAYGQSVYGWTLSADNTVQYDEVPIQDI